ncbi:hypothetical protein BH23ACT9_BH23ACT9_18810 [soil metagenome]
MRVALLDHDEDDKVVICADQAVTSTAARPMISCGGGSGSKSQPPEVR